MLVWAIILQYTDHIFSNKARSKIIKNVEFELTVFQLYPVL